MIRYVSQHGIEKAREPKRLLRLAEIYARNRPELSIAAAVEKIDDALTEFEDGQK